MRGGAECTGELFFAGPRHSCVPALPHLQSPSFQTHPPLWRSPNLQFSVSLGYLRFFLVFCGSVHSVPRASLPAPKMSRMIIVDPGEYSRILDEISNENAPDCVIHNISVKLGMKIKILVVNFQNLTKLDVRQLISGICWTPPTARLLLDYATPSSVWNIQKI